MKRTTLPWAGPAQRDCITAIFLLGIALAAETARADLLGYESFGDSANNSSIINYQSTTPGNSLGLSGQWSQTDNNGATLKHRSSSTGWTAAQDNLTAIGSSYSLLNGGSFNFLECQSWGLERAQSSLTTPIDMTVNGTWYMSFVSSSGNFDYAAQMGLNDGVNELMWGNGYTGGTQGLAAHYGAMSSFNAGNIRGASSISPTMAGSWDVMLYVAELQQVVGTGVTLNMYAYDLNTTTGLPADIIAAGSPLFSTTLAGVNNSFTTLELELSGGSQYPSIGQLRVGTTWADVTAVPEPSTLSLAGLGILAALTVLRRRRA